MKIHHLNCTTMCPVGRNLFEKMPHKMVCHCLLIETNEGLVLVDSGFGWADMKHFWDLNYQAFLAMARPKLDYEETAIAQVKKLGFSADEVKHIVLTHLDFDHAGGIQDFPNAQVHVFEPEFNAATKPITRIDKSRYHQRQWKHDVNWRLYPSAGGQWMGFSCVKQLDGLPPEILMVPLIGHTLGHCGVAVDTKDGWLFHAGDAYYNHGDITPEISSPTPLRIFQFNMAANKEKWFDNQKKLRELSTEKQEKIHLFCAHDSDEFDSLIVKSHSH